MDKGDNPYDVLGIAKRATAAEIKAAYRKLALKHHPDKQRTEEQRAVAHAVFTKISNAYEILNDEKRRREYEKMEEDQRWHTRKSSSASDDFDDMASNTRRPKGKSTSDHSESPPSKQRSPSNNPRRHPEQATSSSADIPKNRGSNKSSFSHRAQNNGNPKRRSSTSGTRSRRSNRTSSSPPKSRTSKRSSSSDNPSRQGSNNRTSSRHSREDFHDPFEIFEEVFGEQFLDGRRRSEGGTYSLDDAVFFTEERRNLDSDSSFFGSSYEQQRFINRRTVRKGYRHDTHSTSTYTTNTTHMVHGRRETIQKTIVHQVTLQNQVEQCQRTKKGLGISFSFW